MHIFEFRRREDNTHVKRIWIEIGTSIQKMSVSHSSQENATEGACPFIVKDGIIEKLFLNDIQVNDDYVLENNGAINKMFLDEGLKQNAKDTFQ